MPMGVRLECEKSILVRHFLSFDNFIRLASFYSKCQYIKFLDGGERVTADGRTPFTFRLLEKCRILISNWNRLRLNPKYAVVYRGGVDYFMFNTSGYLEHYYKRGLDFAYEVPCYVLALETYSNIYMPEHTWGTEASLEKCHLLYRTLVHHVKPWNDGQYFGSVEDGYKFCFRLGWTTEFLVKVDPIEEEFKNYRIDISEFSEDTSNGSIFVSPTLADYECLRLKNQISVKNDIND